jgi:hypothetical protein
MGPVGGAGGVHAGLPGVTLQEIENPTYKLTPCCPFFEPMTFELSYNFDPPDSIRQLQVPHAAPGHSVKSTARTGLQYSASRAGISSDLSR